MGHPFQSPFPETFAPNQFNMSMVYLNHDTTNNRGKSAIHGIINSFIQKLNETDTTCPKWIVVIPESDIIHDIQYNNFGVSAAYGMLIQYVMTQFDNAIRKYFGDGIDLPKNVNKIQLPLLHLDRTCSSHRFT